MNQSLTYEIDQVMPQARDPQLTIFDSLCTIQQPDGNLGPSGAPSRNWVNVSGLVNIPCYNSVPSVLRVQATEVKALADIMSKGLRHVLLNGYYPEASPDGQIPASWRAVVDGVNYDILGVEHDSQNTQTRLQLQLAEVANL